MFFYAACISVLKMIEKTFQFNDTTFTLKEQWLTKLNQRVVVAKVKKTKRIHSGLKEMLTCDF